MNLHDYIIADVTLRSEIDLVGNGLKNFKPFEIAISTETQADCTLKQENDIDKDNIVIIREISSFIFSDTNAQCTLQATNEGYLFTIAEAKADADKHIFVYNTANRSIATNMQCNADHYTAFMRFGLWIMFGIAIAPLKAIAIHSSTIVSQGRGVLFLGESGTGKSTHTRLWRENIDDVRLLNDDSPIVRIVDGELRVYGSPWSGKTHCYKAQHYPIAGFCRLSQAPHNVIHRLSSIMAIGALLPSCPPAFAHDVELQDMICSTLGQMLKLAPVYHLECLPNAEAAYLSHSTIIRDDAR